MNKINPVHTITNQQISRSTAIRLGMAELCPTGLSEQWLLRFGGDIHWSLIAQTMGQESATFQDAYGQDVYAAFCATSVELALVDCLLAQDVRMHSLLYRVSNHQLGSIHTIYLDDVNIATLSMISTFVSHDESKRNSKIVRNKDMPELFLDQAPDELAQIAANARSIARSNLDDIKWHATALDVMPCPSLDFNAVGLLYFPTFSKLAEMAEWKQNRKLNQIKRRDVVYLGNVDIGRSLEISICENRLSIIEGDNRVIANIITDRY